MHLVRVPSQRTLPEAKYPSGPIGATFQYLINQEQRRSGSLGNILTMREYGTDRKFGVPKTAAISDQMIRFASTLLRFDKVHFSEHFTTGTGVSSQEMIDKLMKQLSEYRCEVKYVPLITTPSTPYTLLGSIRTISIRSPNLNGMVLKTTC